MLYFIIRTKTNGVVYDMDKKCTNIDYSDDKLCVFKNKQYGADQTLLILPYSEIGVIELKENK